MAISRRPDSTRLDVEVLNDRVLPALLAFGSVAGSIGVVQVVDADNPATIIRSFIPYGTDFTGGVRVALGDVDGDGVADVVTAPGMGGGPVVHAFSGSTGKLLFTLGALDLVFRGGVNVAVGDLDNDRHADVIVGAGPGGGPQVQVFSGATQKMTANFFAYDVGFAGGVSVTTGNVNADKTVNVVTGPGAGGGPIINQFTRTGILVESFVALDPSFRGGVTVASMKDPFVPDARDVLVAAGPGGAPLIQVYRSQTLVNRFFAVEDDSFRGGINVSSFEEPSGTPYIVAGVNTASSRVIVRNGKDLTFRPGAGSFFVLPGLTPGVNVAAV